MDPRDLNEQPDPQTDYGAGGPYDFDEIDEAIYTDFDNWLEQFQQ